MASMLSVSRRSLLAALAYLGLMPKASLAQVQPTAGELWQPEMLGERLWLAWRAEDVPEGPVASWTDRIAGVTAEQTDGDHRPEKLATGEIAFVGGKKNLVVPPQRRAYIAHRALVILFRADLRAVGEREGTMFHINGLGGPYSVQPAVSYSIDELKVHWRDPMSWNANVFVPAGTAETWHCIVSRRVGGVHYASLDGGPEIETGTDICLGRSHSDQSGLIGDHRDRTIPWAVDSIFLLQDELTQTQAQKFMGWAMWKRGAQDQLPDDHRYRAAPPVWESSDQEAPFVESTEEEWAGIKAYWKSDDLSQTLEQAFLQPLDLSGYQKVFEDHFTTMSITDEVTGTGPWWAPVHGRGTGAARMARVDDDPPCFIQSGSELTIRMQKDDRGWSSGIFTSINLNGHGNTWKYGYFECRARATAGNGFGAWPAFWLKSVNEYFRLTESRMELDAYEGYNSDPKGHHQAYHNWPAKRPFEGRIKDRRRVSNYTGLKARHMGHDIDLFDDQYHTYGVMIDETWIKFYFDNLELSRFPTPVEVKKEVFILIDLALHGEEVDKADGVYEFTLDYVRVYQKV